jgi:hypothetical protein
MWNCKCSICSLSPYELAAKYSIEERKEISDIITSHNPIITRRLTDFLSTNKKDNTPESTPSKPIVG